jgi:capsular exopolysaccharide synthesis family protein
LVRQQRQVDQALLWSGRNTCNQSCDTRYSIDGRGSLSRAQDISIAFCCGQRSENHTFYKQSTSRGKTTTVVNTAMSLAQLGASVLIIDCDLRKPTTHKVLGVNPFRGISTYLSRNIEVDELIQQLPQTNISLLPCGPIPPNPAELISSDKMKTMLAKLSERYDHILIDSPPIINVTDAVILSKMVDGVIMVVHGGRSTREAVRRARQELDSVGAKIFGVVLNNVDLRHDAYDGYYYSQYGYGQEQGSGVKA